MELMAIAPAQLLECRSENTKPHSSRTLVPDQIHWCPGHQALFVLH
jgi:hypothetical protein